MTEVQPQPEAYSYDGEFRQLGWEAPKPKRYRYPNYTLPESKELHKELRKQVRKGGVQTDYLIYANDCIANLLNAPLQRNENGSMDFKSLTDAGLLMFALEEISETDPKAMRTNLMTSKNVLKAYDEFTAFMKRGRSNRVKDAMVSGNNWFLLNYALMGTCLTLCLSPFLDPNTARHQWEISLGVLTALSNVLSLAVVPGIGADKSIKYIRLQNRKRKIKKGEPLNPREFLNAF